MCHCFLTQAITSLGDLPRSCLHVTSRGVAQPAVGRHRDSRGLTAVTPKARSQPLAKVELRVLVLTEQILAYHSLRRAVVHACQLSALCLRFDVCCVICEVLVTLRLSSTLTSTRQRCARPRPLVTLQS